MTSKNVRATKMSNSGRNVEFEDSGGRRMTRGEFADLIESGAHPRYHVRRVGGLRTPAANPDGKKGNNLG